MPSLSDPEAQKRQAEEYNDWHGSVGFVAIKGMMGTVDSDMKNNSCPSLWVIVCAQMFSYELWKYMLLGYPPKKEDIKKNYTLNTLTEEINDNIRAAYEKA